MAELLSGKSKLDKNVKAKWGMKITRGTGHGKGSLSEERMEPLSMEKIASMEEASIHSGLDRIDHRGSAPTGFAKYFQEQVVAERRGPRGVRVQGGMVAENGQPMTLAEESEISADMKRSARSLSDRTGFADHVERMAEQGLDEDIHEDDRLDSEEGPAGFGTGFHGSSPEDYPDDRDKKLPYGGNAIGGARRRDWSGRHADDAEVNEERGIGERTHKEVPHQSRRTGGAGTTLDGESDPITTVVPLQSEVVDVRNKHDIHQDLLPQEPAGADVPQGEHGQRDMTDPLPENGEIFEEGAGSWQEPGVNQNYPDRKPKVTPIMGMAFTLTDGFKLNGTVTKEAADHYIILGIRPGRKTAEKLRIFKEDIANMKPILAKPEESTSKIASIYDKLSVNEQTSNNEYRREAKKVEGENSILSRFFGLGKGKGEKFDGANLAHTEENIEGDGELYGDDKALKDQLKEHEKKMGALKQAISLHIAKSSEFEKVGREKEADAMLDIAEKLAKELKNTGIRTAQLQKLASTKREDTRPFFKTRESGSEGFFA